MAAPRPRPTREYSDRFPMDYARKRRQINIDFVPPELFKAVKAKAKRDGVSIRVLVLEYLERWSAQ